MRHVSLNPSAPPAERRQITIRSLAGLTVRDLPGTYGALNPFFSPDGRWIAFFTPDGELKKAALGGGTPVTIATKIASTSFTAGVWVDADRVIFGGIGTGLTEVAADGGTRKELVTLDAANGEDRHLPRSIIPGTRVLLFRTAARLEALDIDSGERRVIIDPGGFGDAVGNHLLFRRDDALLVAPFDPARLALAGPAVPVADDVRYDGPFAGGSTPQAVVSANGTLAYLSLGNAATLVLGTVRRDGTFTPVAVEPGRLSRPRVSPDGQRVLLTRVRPSREMLVQMYDVARGTTTTLTRSERNVIGLTPVWRPDGGAVAVNLRRPEADGIYLVGLDGSERLVLKADAPVMYRPESFSPDGRTLAYTRQQGSQFDVWTVEIADPSTARPFVNSAAAEHSPGFSPDGRWLAYVSNATGRTDVYVRGYPQGDAVQISSTAARGPVWSRDSRTLFFEATTPSGPALMSASIAPGASTVNVGVPVFVLNQRAPGPSGAIEEYVQSGNWGAEFDLLPDGRFVMLRGPDPQGVREIVIVQNWFEELKRLAPVRP